MKFEVIQSLWQLAVIDKWVTCLWTLAILLFPKVPPFVNKLKLSSSFSSLVLGLVLFSPSTFFFTFVQPGLISYFLNKCFAQTFSLIPFVAIVLLVSAAPHKKRVAASDILVFGE
jgi:hypothetical protein